MGRYLASELTQARKDYITEGYTVSDWENFLTGLQSTYSQVGQQVSEQAAYDISGAYANYKQQQLQLQMNQQLGAGFKEQVGSELQSAYESAFSDVKSQEAQTLSEVVSAYDKSIASAEEAYAKEGKKLQQVSNVLDEIGSMLGVTKFKDEDMYKTSTIVNDKGETELVRELTDVARYYYDSILTNPEFEAYLLDDTGDKYIGDLSYEDREELFEYMKNNRDVIAGTITGLNDNWDKTATEQRIAEIDYNTPKTVDTLVARNRDKEKDFSTANSGDPGDNFEIKYNNEYYKVERGSIASTDVQNKLTNEYEYINGTDDVELGTIMVYQDEIYMYLPNNNTNKDSWVRVRGRQRDTTSYDTLRENLNLSKKPKTQSNVEKYDVHAPGVGPNYKSTGSVLRELFK
jgi:hypothetical protein